MELHRRELCESPMSWISEFTTSPSKPEAFRPHSARPQSHRFLQETSLKLAQDMVHSHQQRFPATTSPPPGDESTVCPASVASPLTLPPASASPPTLPSLSSSPVPRYYEEGTTSSSFLVEASECVRSLSGIFDSVNASTFASRFEGWRKVDPRAAAQVQHFLKLLNCLNKSMDDFLMRCLPREELKDFNWSMLALVQSVKDLENFQMQLNTSMEAFCTRIVSNAVASWKETSAESFSQLESRLDLQIEQHRMTSAQQQRFDSRLEAMGIDLGHLCQKMHDQDKHATQSHASLHSISQACCSIGEQQAGMGAKHLEIDKGLQVMARRLDLMSEASTRQSEQFEDCLSSQSSILRMFTTTAELQKAMHDSLSARLPWWQENLQERLLEQWAADCEDLKRYVDEVLGKPPTCPPVGETLATLETKTDTWVTSTLHDLSTSRDEVDRLQSSLKYSQEEIDELKNCRDSVLNEQAELESSLEKVNRELLRVQGDLVDASSKVISRSLERLQSIEARGNVKVDRQNGQIILSKSIAFLPAAPKAASYTVNFKGPAVAQTFIADVAEVIKIFDIPVELTVTCKEPRQKGKEGPWRELALKRAELMKQELEKEDGLANKVSASGTLAKQDELTISFNKSYFATKLEGGKGKGKRGRSASPRR